MLSIKKEMSKNSRSDEYFRKCKEKFGIKIDYTDSIYINRDEDITVKCNVCNNHTTTSARSHYISTYGCNICAVELKKKPLTLKKKNNEEFMIESIDIFGDRFDYSECFYVNTYTNVILTCKICNTRNTVNPRIHLKSIFGCKTCADNAMRWTKEKFVEEAIKVHNYKFDYSKVVYVDAKTPVIIICNDCDSEFPQKPHAHITGRSCKTCANIKLTKTLEQFIEQAIKIHAYRYDYSKVVYVDTDTKVIIICNKCKKEFPQTPDSHLFGRCGCPYCRMSHGEVLIANLLDRLNIEYIPQHKYSDCRFKKMLPFDFYLPKYNLHMEYDGKQHREPVERFGGEERFKEGQIKDKIKNDYCLKNKINLLRIPSHFKDERIPSLFNDVFNNPIGVKEHIDEISNDMLFYFFKY